MAIVNGNSTPSDRKQLFPNYQFLIYVNNVELQFSKVSGIEASIEMEEIHIGGINNTPFYVAAPKKKASVLTLEKGICLSEHINNWKPGLYLEGPIEIFVMSNLQTRSYIHNYYMTAGVISKWEINTLDALGQEILIDKFEITHSGIEIK